MENQIQIIFEPSNDNEGNPTMIWYYGDVVVNGFTYPFSLCEMYEPNTGTSSYEVTWVDETPENSKGLEKMIEDKFDELN